ncbi:MAG: fibronectin type III-like domain-contianing protein, partial [Lachnospiraceae bacterium]|nr:fibronectin type III-like domain-contianing protein [Lachnospiraceae bacterium]
KITDVSFKNEKSFDEASKDGVTICVKAVNASAIETEDVLQVYVHVNGTKDEVLNTKLAAFMRVKLGANEEKAFEITVPGYAFTTVDDEGTRSVTGNAADIYVGFNGADKRTEELTGTKAAVLNLK